MACKRELLKVCTSQVTAATENKSKQRIIDVFKRKTY